MCCETLNLRRLNRSTSSRRSTVATPLQSQNFDKQQRHRICINITISQLQILRHIVPRWNLRAKTAHPIIWPHWVLPFLFEWPAEAMAVRVRDGMGRGCHDRACRAEIHECDVRDGRGVGLFAQPENTMSEKPIRVDHDVKIFYYRAAAQRSC
eukprot:4695319-Pleurochrysis_carterae.AAC.1